jgi:hypothetical protein
LNADEWLEAITRMRQNFKKGGVFEDSVLWNLGIDPADLQKAILDGGFRPDLPFGYLYGVTDVKDVIYITITPQIRGFFNAAQPGMPFRLIISTRTNQIAESVIEMIINSGGEIWEFNPITKTWRQLVLPGSGPWKR